MKDDRINYVVVGVFVIGMAVALVASIAKLTDRTGATDPYFTRYDDATGLKRGSQVLYMGYPVGHVKGIEAKHEAGRVYFELELALEKQFTTWQVPRDSVAQVKASGLLAAVLIDIRAGTAGEPLQPGDIIDGLARRDVFSAVSDTANTVRELTLGTIKPLLENLNRHVSAVGDVLQTRGVPLVENLSTLSEELASRAPSIIDDLLTTSRDLRAVTNRVEALLSAENAGKLGSVVDKMVAASENVVELTSNARTQVGRLLDDNLVAQVQSVTRNADAAAGSLAAAGERAREGIDAALGEENLTNLRATLADASAAAAGARTVVGPEQQRKVSTSLDSVHRATAEAEALLVDTRAQLRELLGPRTVQRVDAALANISEAAANLSSLSAHLDERVDQVLNREMAEKLQLTLANFARAASGVATLSRNLNRSQRDLEAMLAALRGMAEDNRADVRASIEDLRHSLGVVAQHIDGVASALEGTSRNMFEFSTRLKANPGLLLRGGPPSPDAPRVPRGG